MKRCAKCSARNEDDAVVCSLCNESLKPVAALENFEPRLWTDGKQRFRGESKDDVKAGTEKGKDAPAAAAADANTERHYLLTPVGEPIKLDTAGGLVALGRDESCNVPVASASVSRKHAEIRFRGEPLKAYLRDLGSQNGTIVNDTKVEQEKMLHDGDVLKLGDFTAVYRLLHAGEDASKLKSRLQQAAASGTVRLEGEESGAHDALLVGDASIIQIHEVLRRLGGLHAHGTLDVDVSGIKGHMKLVDGKVASGSYAGLEGQAAIQAMLELKKGRYRFEPDRPLGQASPATQRLDGHMNVADGKTPGPIPLKNSPGQAAAPRTASPPGGTPARRAPGAGAAPAAPAGAPGPASSGAASGSTPPPPAGAQGAAVAPAPAGRTVTPHKPGTPPG